MDVGVIISDTFGRTWRRGVTDVAIGCAGVAAVIDLRGTLDANGRELVATEICVADELASAAELVMGKDRGIPAAIVRGVPAEWLRRASVHAEIVRPPERGPLPLNRRVSRSGDCWRTNSSTARGAVGQLRPRTPSELDRRPARYRDSSARALRDASGAITVDGSTPACSAMVV